ncbi:hypothetical protein [Streptomyces sp. NPDC059788]|uniref:hypothetical protein n=1 Tax=Streptomyces sp. NPDC059788 TaxID=3346948 RepID=UPI003668D4F0
MGLVLMVTGLGMFGLDLVGVVQSSMETGGHPRNFPPNMFKWFGLGIVGGVVYELGKAARG